MLLKLINWLKLHKALNLALVFIYGIALIFFHDFFVGLSYNAMNKLSLPVYNKVVLIFSATLSIGILAYFLFKLFRTTENKNRKLFFLLVTFALIALHYKFLFEMNIEIIHVVEFAFLSLLLFPLLGSFGTSVVFTLPFIFVNEWYQYVVLYPNYIHYFEFNDIVIDLLGCGMAMIFLWIAGVKPTKNLVGFISLTLIDVLFIVLLVTCVFALYPSTECENTFLVLNQLPNPHLFWQTHVYGAIYHVMKPVEGMLAINLVCLFFTAADFYCVKR